MTMLRSVGYVGLGAIMLGALVTVAVPQATTVLSAGDKAILTAIQTGVETMAGAVITGFFNVKIHDAAGNELNYTPPGDATVSAVNDASVSTLCLAANVARQGARFYNDSTQAAYLLEDQGTASATSFTVKMDPGGLYILPMNTSGVYTDEVRCIWAADASGAMRVTEITP